ncbi:hypothetical protein GPJ56_009125 [Histomonas meleagridis]|uniref:uncharacterized protein n=1 Tax=Histomonas meleagridis TaxID=135588 RepID=UPI00355A9508|nr:hypothetical protein GPJ56_009125 [Histomonas meleagridis]KAH0799218.1 hypothetical protein GO595_008015 [Histomonas meleagridis]
MNEIRIYQFLKQELSNLEDSVIANRQLISTNQIKIFKQLEILCKWLIDHPRPYLIDVSHSTIPLDFSTLHQNPTLYKTYFRLKTAINEKLEFISTFPKQVFSSNIQNISFLKSAIESGLSSMKNEINYFEPIPIEEPLYLFLESPSSPLTNANLIPIQVTNDDKSVLQWLNNAKNEILSFLSVDDENRQNVINVFLERFLFDRKYPLLSYETKEHPEFISKIAKMAQLTPDKVGVVTKYIPKELVSEPIWKIFKHSTFSEAPVEWLHLAQFKVCPLDAGYCLSKAHESISIMATLQATENGSGDNVKDFFAKVPGFDDIFGLWICLLCSTEIGDPFALSEFLLRWSCLPCFGSRFAASCSYLEACLVQIGEFQIE